MLRCGVDLRETVIGDTARLQQIQANLLSNAEYSAPDGHVRFELRGENGHAMIRVSDNGCGIEPDMLPRIFDLFVQGNQSIARAPDGRLSSHESRRAGASGLAITARTWPRFVV